MSDLDFDEKRSPNSLSAKPSPSNVTDPMVSIIIVSWNVRDILRNCLLSVTEQTAAAHQIVVVDNCSGDGSAEMVRSEFPAVELIANGENRGFAAANNQALKLATGRFILFLNPDTVVLDRAIDKMIAWCAERPDVGCAGCQVLETTNKIQRTCFADPSPWTVFLIESGLQLIFAQSRFWGYPSYSWWDRRSEQDVDVVSGMFMLIPKKTIEKIGDMDEAFFVYAEEADLCRRIRQAGQRCVFTPIAQIMHCEGGGKSTTQIKARMQVQLSKSLFIYLNKHNSRPGIATAKAIVVISNFARWIVFGLQSAVSRSEYSRARAERARVLLAYHFFGEEPRS